MIDSVIALSRRIRWWVIAKRCASSRTRWSSCSSGVSCGSRSGCAHAGHEDLLDPLGERDDGDAAVAEALRRASRPADELARAAVDHDQVRQRGERRVAVGVVGRALVLPLPLRVPAREHLVHRGEVVVAIVAANREAPVIGLLRRAALEHDHRGDGVRAADVRDVEALDPHRQRVEPERALQPVERLDALLAPALGLELLLVEREPRVALGQLEDAPLVAALGRADLDARRRGARPAARPARRARSPPRAPAGRRSAPGSRARSCSTGAGTPRRRSPAPARPGCRGRTTGGPRARRRGPGRPARWPPSRRRRPRPRRTCPSPSLATRWRSSSARTACRRLRSSAACS